MATIATLTERAKHLLHSRRDLMAQNEWLRQQLAVTQTRLAGASAANAVLARMVERAA